MQPHLRKLLLKEFDHVVTLRLPEFSQISDAGIRGLGGRLYRKQKDCDVSVFVLLVPSLNRNEFTIEVAWSRNSSFPQHRICGNSVPRPELGVDADVPKNDEFRFRIGAFDGRQGDKWWRTSSQLAQAELPPLERLRSVHEVADEQKLPADQIKSSVEEAIQELIARALPFVDRSLDDRQA
jgi:hypothetical protein